MPLTCSRCSTVNPDDNAFCAHCGTPLTAPAGGTGATAPAVPPVAPAAPAPVAAAPAPSPAPVPAPAPAAPPAPAPAPVPVAAAAPIAPAPVVAGQPVAPSYYAQPGATPWAQGPPVAAAAHRTSSTMVIAAVVVAVVVVGAIGGIIAMAHSGPKPLPPQGPGFSVPTPQPTAPPQPSHTPAPTTAPTPGTSGGGNTVTTSFATIPVPSGFTVGNQSDKTVELDPSGGGPGQIFITAVPLNQAESNDALAQAILTQLDAPPSWPDAALCGGKAAGAVTLTGSNGPIPALAEAVCGHYTPQNGQAFSAVDFYAAGVATSSGGSPEAVMIEVFCPTDSYQAFTATIPDSFFNGVRFNGSAPTS